MNKPATRVVVIYVYPIFGGHHDGLAQRFAATYREHLPSVPHTLTVVSNGGPPTATMRETFRGIECNWLEHDDSGWDIGAYRKAASRIPCDLMVFFGGSSYLRRRGWLERMIESFETHGVALYGSMGSHCRSPHLRTTGWWCPPTLLNDYPYPTTSEQSSRYEFEHGPNSITLWAVKLGLKAFMVTWDGYYEMAEWPTVPNGFQIGDQSALIVGDRMVPELA